MKNYKYLSFLLLLAIVMILYLSCTHPSQEVKIASGGHGLNFLPLDVALANNFFEKEGITPKVDYITGGTETALALIGGSVDFATNSVDQAIKAKLQGKELRMIFLFNKIPGVMLVVDSKYKGKINAPADLRGRSVGVTSPGSATHMLLNYILAKNNVKPEEVEVIKAGTSTLPAALEHGDIVAGISIEPFSTYLLKTGKAFPLVDLSSVEGTVKTFGALYNQTGILTRPDVIKTNRKTVQKFVKALQQATKWINEHSAEEIANTLPSEWIGEKELFIESLERVKKEMFTIDGYISIEGVNTVIESFRTFGLLKPEDKIDSLELIDNSFIKQ